MELCLGRLKPLFKHEWFHNSAVVKLGYSAFQNPALSQKNLILKGSFIFCFYFNTVLEKNFFVCFLIRHSQRSRIRVLASSLNSWVPSWVCVMTSLISFLLMCLFSIGQMHCLELQFLCKQYCFRCFSYPAVNSITLIYELTYFIQVCFMMNHNTFSAFQFFSCCFVFRNLKNALPRYHYMLAECFHV